MIRYVNKEGGLDFTGTPSLQKLKDGPSTHYKNLATTEHCYIEKPKKWGIQPATYQCAVQCSLMMNR
jgi:hypothetical protein